MRFEFRACTHFGCRPSQFARFTQTTVPTPEIEVKYMHVHAHCHVLYRDWHNEVAHKLAVVKKASALQKKLVSGN